jgi:hypothetical protein
MRKTIKNRQSTTTPHESSINFVPSPSSNQLMPSTIDEQQDELEVRNNRVNSILNTMTSVNVGENNKMGEFKPISPPEITVKKDTEPVEVSIPYVQPSHTYVDASNDHKHQNLQYGMNEGTTQYSNYNKSYDPPKNNYTKPYYASSVSSGSSDTKLMEKINYMLHLLEEQQHEKTDNITEEFILYTFLGVFIIYIVDAFARNGKYTR